MQSPIPHTRYNEGTPLLFAHANGYPPDCYSPLYNLLGGYQINAIHQRPLWDESQPGDIKDWHPLSDDLLRFMDEQKMDKLIAIGHSMGGITILRAALREPERFSRVILLDPVLFPPFFIFYWNVVRALKLEYKLHPLVPAAQKRRRIFKSRELMLRGYRNKAVFKYFSDEALESYVNGITCPLGDGSYQLCYSAEWETQIYVTGVWRDMELWKNLPNLMPPLLIIRGAETDTFYESAGKLVKKKLPNATVVSIPKSTHLLPLEQPKAVANEIRKFIKSA
jgi:pimeloyl-ACP methyl ester carboxylesterase